MSKTGNSPFIRTPQPLGATSARRRMRMLVYLCNAPRGIDASWSIACSPSFLCDTQHSDTHSPVPSNLGASLDRARAAPRTLSAALRRVQARRNSVRRRA